MEPALSSIPQALARLFDPLEGLLADASVERLLIGEALHVRRAGEWESRALPFDASILARAVEELVPASGALELPLEAGATLLAFAPPVVDHPVLSLRRPATVGAEDALLSRRSAWETLDIAVDRALNLVVVGAEPRARHAFMATMISRTGGGAVLVDLPAVQLDTPRVIRLRSADEASLLDWAPRLGGLRVCWDASHSGVDHAIDLVARRVAPVIMGVPGHRAADGLAWLAGHATKARAAILLGAGVDLVVCVDGPILTAIEAVEAGAEGPTLVPLHLALPSGALTEERGHADWVARWQRVMGSAPALSMPPDSLTDALRIARAQADHSALPVTDVPSVSGRDEAESTVEGRVAADPLTALLAQLGENADALEEEVDLDLSEDDEDEETMVQVEAAPRGSRRTFSEILRSLDDDTGAGSIHVRRERITQIRDED